jgi:hypothetical protein
MNLAVRFNSYCLQAALDAAKSAMFALKKRRQAAALQGDQRLVRRSDDCHATLAVMSRRQLRHVC